MTATATQDAASTGCVGIIPAMDAECITEMVDILIAAVIAVDDIPALMAKRT